MKVLIDLNVILDVLLKREPYHADAAAVLALAERRSIEGFICAASVDTLHFLLKRETAPADARGHLRTVLSILAVADLTADCVRAAFDSGWPDLEDAIVYESARHAGAEAVITRNQEDFRRGDLLVLSPTELLALRQSQGQ